MRFKRGCGLEIETLTERKYWFIKGRSEAALLVCSCFWRSAGAFGLRRRSVVSVEEHNVLRYNRTTKFAEWLLFGPLLAALDLFGGDGGEALVCGR